MVGKEFDSKRAAKTFAKGRKYVRTKANITASGVFPREDLDTFPY